MANTLWVVACNPLFENSFRLFGCFISHSIPNPCCLRTFVFSIVPPRSFLSSNVSVHPRCTLCAVEVERLVGFHFHRLFLASLSQIVPAWFETFLSLWWRVRCARSSPLFSDPTSGFRRRPTGNTIYDCSVRRRSHSGSLWAVAWNPLFEFLIVSGF